MGIKVYPVPVGYGRGHIDGLQLGTVVDTDHDRATTAGECLDSTNSRLLKNTGTIIKQIDANWAEGTNAGGFPSGLGLASDTWYLYFLIAKPNGQVDFGWDTSDTATNLLADATGYTMYRRIGFDLTDGSSNIVSCIQEGDEITWSVPLLIIDTSPTVSDAGESYTVGPPIRTKVLISAALTGNSSAEHAYFRSPEVIDDTPAWNAVPGGSPGSTAATGSEVRVESHTDVRTNASGEIKGSAQYAGVNFYLNIIGYKDRRGKE